MRVVHLSCIAPPQIGGIGRVAAQDVAGLRSRGVDATLISPTMHPTFWHVGNAAALNIHRIINDLNEADVVHLHYPFYGTAGMIVRLRRRGVIKRLVMTLHMDATAGGFRGLYFDLHRRIAQPRILKMADALLVSSLEYARHSSYARFVDNRRMHELPFGVDEKQFSPALAAGSWQLAARHQSNPQLPATSYQLLFVGGMDTAHAFKGVDVLLRAMTQMPQNVTLTLVGDGNLRPSYEKLARGLGISSRVKFLGRVSENELPNIYRSADVFAFPSTNGAEAFGLAALEAQSSGVPVVASNLPGVRTVVANGETGFLVPPGDVEALAKRLHYLLDHDDVRHAMGHRARERVLERFTWTKYLEGLMNIYQKLLYQKLP